MDRMRIAEQRKEVMILICFYLQRFHKMHLCLKAIVRLMEEGFGERVWSFRAVKA